MPPCGDSYQSYPSTSEKWGIFALLLFVFLPSCHTQYESICIYSQCPSPGYNPHRHLHEFTANRAQNLASVQFSSVAQSCPTLCNPMKRSTPGFPIHHQLPQFTQTHVHRVSDAIQPSHPLSSPSPPAPNPCQHQSLFQWVNSSHEVAKGLEFQL